MKSPFSFIVRPYNGRRYDNIKEVGGIELITSVSQEDHTVSNRYAEVVSTPINYTGRIEPGDTLLVHHNVFKYYYDMKGLYKNEDGWHTHDKYCFVKPAEKQEHYLDFAGQEQPLVGYIKYINDELLSYGLKQGDKISYKPDSEYEFEVDGEKLYRMFTNHITIQLNDGHKENETGDQDTKKMKQEIISAGEKAVKQLIKVAEEKIITDNPDSEIAADRLKNAAATKKLAIFDAFEILTRIEAERSMLNEVDNTKNLSSFAERKAK
jgi:hypothetical protein